MSEKQAPKISAVIVAAGRGERLGGTDGPKQYRLLGGRSILARTVDAFTSHPEIDSVVVVIHAVDAERYSNSVPGHTKLQQPAIGGATRQISVAAGLEALSSMKPDYVLIHDAARPFIDSQTITGVIDGLGNNACILPTVAVADTLKRVDEAHQVTDTVSRDGLHGAQTPQGFHFPLIRAAHQQAAEAGRTDFTDDSALAEWAGHTVYTVSGNPRNTKITTATDLQEAQAMLTTGLPDIRVGHGYDTHQLVPGTHIWLCGVEIPHTHKLSGHSDADVGLHSLTDALLAAIADGDIGSHFPPSDEKWRGARSDQFLKHAVERVQNAGGQITHMDVTLLCEQPKIGPHRDAMREAIAGISGVDVQRISVKATTNERIGFIGREEGIVALATATVVMGTL